MDINQALAVRNVLLELQPELNEIKVLKQPDRKLIHQAAKAFEKQSQSKSSRSVGSNDPAVERLRENLSNPTASNSKSNPFMRLIKGIANLFHLRISSERALVDVGFLKRTQKLERIKPLPWFIHLLSNETKVKLRSLLALSEGEDFTLKVLLRCYSKEEGLIAKCMEYLVLYFEENSDPNWRMNDEQEREFLEGLQNVEDAYLDRQALENLEIYKKASPVERKQIAAFIGLREGEEPSIEVFKTLLKQMGNW